MKAGIKSGDDRCLCFRSASLTTLSPHSCANCSGACIPQGRTGVPNRLLPPRQLPAGGPNQGRYHLRRNKPSESPTSREAHRRSHSSGVYLSVWGVPRKYCQGILSVVCVPLRSARFNVRTAKEYRI